MRYWFNNRTIYSAVVGVWVNKSYGIQSAITTSVVMTVPSSGMICGHEASYSKNAPILSYINPVNLVSDSFIAYIIMMTLVDFT